MKQSPKDRLVKVLNSDPVDLTARLVTGPGEHYEPPVPQGIAYSREPFPLVDHSWLGFQFGRFTVMGKVKRRNRRYASYSCRCTCGSYELRPAKFIFSPRNQDDCCWVCRQQHRPSDPDVKIDKRRVPIVVGDASGYCPANRNGQDGILPRNRRSQSSGTFRPSDRNWKRITQNIRVWRNPEK